MKKFLTFTNLCLEFPCRLLPKVCIISLTILDIMDRLPMNFYTAPILRSINKEETWFCGTASLHNYICDTFRIRGEGTGHRELEGGLRNGCPCNGFCCC